ncbi:MAG: AAA family ATPase [Pseudomonadota bacterium]
MSEPVFPITAVVGQDQLKLALQLVLVDARIGGLLISGQRGSAKSTLVRSVTALLGDKPLVTLPLGATEDKVIGSLHLERALKDNAVEFSPGLLARAHGGILYVDEVNLLADHLVDALLDAAASGKNRVERDGVSHEHAAEFSLVGTMNPDEGELRPQLLDRFGLMATVQNEFTLDQRQRIVASRLSFDRDPVAFVSEHESAVAEMSANIRWAVDRVESCEVPEDVCAHIAQLCHSYEVEGFRADITLYRAARAYASLHRRSVTIQSDVDAVADLVLQHRANRSDRSDPPSQAAQRQRSGSSLQGDWTPKPESEGAAGRSSFHEVELGAIRHFLPPTQTLATPYRSVRKSVDVHTRARIRGHFKSRQIQASNHNHGAVDWYSSLIRSATGNGLTHTNQLVRKKPVEKGQWLNLIALDTSASTVGRRTLARAKGVVQHLISSFYIRREAVGVLTFGNDSAQTALIAKRSPKQINQWLRELRAGGGTPLTKALQQLSALSRRFAGQGYRVRLFLLTDGRVRAQPDVHQLRPDIVEGVLIDTESGATKWGLARRLAEQLSVSYAHIDQLPDS